MHGELLLSTATLLGFLLTLARITGAFLFVPLPGMTSGFDLARTLLSLSITVALFPYWPHPQSPLSFGLLVAWIVAEAALGIGIGLSVSFIAEALHVAAQIMGLQAGYAYASTVDPTSQADSSVLVVFAQLAAGLLFLAMGLHREVIRTFARSLEVAPAGSIVISKEVGREVLALGGTMFSTGVRLALPVIAILLLVDISLALLGRINAQLQLLTIAFPAKMLVGLGIFGWLLLLIPVLLRSGSEAALSVSKSLLVH